VAAQVWCIAFDLDGNTATLAGPIGGTEGLTKSAAAPCMTFASPLRHRADAPSSPSGLIRG
jgi:hypothetical protein